MSLAVTCSRRRKGVALLSLVFACASVHAAAAAEPPSWKFVPGLKNRYRLTQDMDVSIDLGAGGVQTEQFKNVIDTSWTVAEVQPDGSAVLKQKIDRMRLTITAPGAKAVEFDTKSTDEPDGFAAMVAPLYRAMTKAEFTVTMTPRGKITDVKAPDSLLAAIAAAPGSPLLGELATAEGFQKMVSRSSFEIPDELQPGAEWSTTTEANTPPLGKQTIKITYRYEGPRQKDGVELEAFKPTLEIGYSGGDSTVKVTKQESQGEVLFNRTAGRLESMQLDHELSQSITTDGKTVTQSLKQATAMKWLAEDEE